METLAEDQRIGFIQRETKKAQRELNDFNQAQMLDPLDLMLDSSEIENRLLSLPDLTPGERDRLSSRLFFWLVNGVPMVAMSVAVVFTILTILSMILTPDADVLTIVLALGAFASCIVPFCIDQSRFAVKTLARKALKRDTNRILEENQERAEQNRKLIDESHSNLAKAKKRLDKLAPVYAQAYPGKRLRVSDDNLRIVEVHSDPVIQRILETKTGMGQTCKPLNMKE